MGIRPNPLPFAPLLTQVITGVSASLGVINHAVDEKIEAKNALSHRERAVVTADAS